MTESQSQHALSRIEAERLRRGLSVRRAAARTPKVSESYWRMLVNGGVKQSGVWVPRTATTQQLLWMAAAVGIGEEIAEMLGTEPVSDGRTSVDRQQIRELRETLVELLRRVDELEEGGNAMNDEPA